MSENNRREFLKKSLLMGAGISLIPELAKSSFNGSAAIDISAVKGSDYFNCTITAVEKLGGISKFVPKGSRVALLHNAPNWWSRPGSHTNTDVVLAAIKLLNDAGAKEIIWLINPADDFYKRSSRSEQFSSLTKEIKSNSGEHKETEIPKGVSLKSAKIIKDLFDCDVFINIPITKHHAGCDMSNNLKNFMGNCKGETNKFFHSSTDDFLSQCIADVNLVRKPDLCICDATEVLKTNGPAGPGEIIKPQKVYAGTDPVAMDAYGSTLLGAVPGTIRTTVMAAKHGLGEMELSKVNVLETTL
jgi:uncharacterized protein (DUF362 family)